MDIKDLKEAHIPNSRSRKKKEHKDAQDALEHAKQNVSITYFVKQGDCQFSRSLKNFDKKKNDFISIPGMYDMEQAAEYLNIPHATFYSRSVRYKLPFVKHSKRKYFSKETLDDHKENSVFRFPDRK